MFRGAEIVSFCHDLDRKSGAPPLAVGCVATVKYSNRAYKNPGAAGMLKQHAATDVSKQKACLDKGGNTARSG
jgi:hypothetical protein